MSQICHRNFAVTLDYDCLAKREHKWRICPLS